MYSYSINPNIAKIESDRDFVPKFPLGESFHDHSALSDAQIKISFDISNDIPYPINGLQKFHYFRGGYGNDEVYYERPVGMGIKLKMLVKNLLSDPKLTVNDAYFKFVRLRIGSVFPPGVHLADILVINLLERMYTPVHCAAISLQQDGILLFAPPDTGKTLTTFLALKRGYSYLAEDIAFVDQNHIYANPYTSSFLHNEKLVSSNINYRFFYLLKKIPLLSAYARTPQTSISNMINNVRVQEKARIKKIFILERGETGIAKVDPKDAMRKIMLINRNEFTYYRNSLLFAYSYFNPSLNLDKLMKMEASLISSIVEKIGCSILRANNPEEYIHLIERSNV